MSQPSPFLVDDEQRAVVDLARAFFGEHTALAPDRVPLAGPTQADIDAWTTAVERLGLLDAARTALGFAVAVLGEAGAALYAGPALSALAVDALLTASSGDSAARKQLLADLEAGRRIGLDTTVLRPGAVPGVRVVHEGEGRRVSGVLPAVLDLPDDGSLLLWADGELLAVPADALTRAPGVPLDLSRSVVAVELDTVAEVVGALDAATFASVRARVALVHAAERVGGVREALARTVSYVSGRLQFGRPVGAFQAVQHRLADLAAAHATAEAAVGFAAHCLDVDHPAGPHAAAVATCAAAEAAEAASAAMVQLHGGIAITAEHVAHRFLRRAWSDSALAGDAAALRATLAPVLTGAPAQARFVLPTGGDLAVEVETWLAGVRAVAPTAGPEADPEADPEGWAAWWRLLGEAGWATPSWPVEHGGRGLSAAEGAVVDTVLADAGLGRPYAHIVPLRLVGPTLLRFGTPSQQERHLPGIRTAEVMWCQLFSEPGAGSDLASLGTRAEQVEGGWRISGQKVWSSLAAEADRGILLARTDPDVAQHRGITCFLLDMHAPGVEVRPLLQITGERHFCEVFLDDVLVPDDERLGEVGAGWQVAVSLLGDERAGLSGGPTVGPGEADRLLPRGADDDRVRRLLVAERALQMLALRGEVRAAHGARGPEGSITKLLHSELLQRTAELEVVLAGPDAAFVGPPGTPAYALLDTRRATIAGGTSEIQRTVIAERVLRLPRADDPERHTPWRDRRR